MGPQKGIFSCGAHLLTRDCVSVKLYRSGPVPPIAD